MQYQEFIRFLFNQEESKEDWRFDFDIEEPELSDEETIEFITRLLKSYATDLSAYSDRQLGMGMEYIFNNSFSNLSFVIREGSVNIEKRLTAIRALKNFFKDCLNERCIKSLGHLSEEGNQLNHFCYMLWDTTPLMYCEESPEKDTIYSVLVEVMEYSLSLSNIACIESGLHGLGHLEFYYPKAAASIRRFIDSNKNLDERLITYATYAEKGQIQ